MFPLSLVRSLVLSAINSDNKSAYHEHSIVTSHIVLTVHINNGTVYYGIIVLVDDFNKYEDIPNASLDDVLRYAPADGIVIPDVEFLDLYANYYSLNKNQLSENLGISRPTLNKYLSGTTPLPLIYKKFIALDFGIPSHLLDFDFLSTDNYCPLTKQQLETLPF